MKKVLMLALAVLISVAFATGTFAQAPAGTSEQTTTTTTSTTVTKKQAHDVHRQSHEPGYGSEHDDREGQEGRYDLRRFGR